MSERMETQISGKYSEEESRLFDFKNLLEQANLHVNYPAGNEIIKGNHDFAITHKEELDQSFNKTEVAFLRSIKETPIHVVFNIFKENEGYIGESASIEIVYALAHNKPIVLLRNPVFAESVPKEIRDVIAEKIDKINIEKLDSLAPEELKKYVNNLTIKAINYELSDGQKITCMRFIRDLLKNKSRDWKSNQQLKTD